MPGGGTCKDAPQIARAPETEDLYEEMGGGTTVGWEPDTRGAVQIAKEPEARWHGGWQF